MFEFNSDFYTPISRVSISRQSRVFIVVKNSLDRAIPIFIINHLVEIGLKTPLVADSIIQLLVHLCSRVRPPRRICARSVVNQIVNKSSWEDRIRRLGAWLEDRL